MGGEHTNMQSKQHGMLSPGREPGLHTPEIHKSVRKAGVYFGDRKVLTWDKRSQPAYHLPASGTVTQEAVRSEGQVCDTGTLLFAACSGRDA